MTETSLSDTYSNLYNLGLILTKAINWKRIQHDKSATRKILRENIQCLSSTCKTCSENNAIKLSCNHLFCLNCNKSDNGYICPECSYQVSDNELGLFNEIIGDSIKCRNCNIPKFLFDYYYKQMPCNCFCISCTRDLIQGKIKNACKHFALLDQITENCERCKIEENIKQFNKLKCGHYFCDTCSRLPSCISCEKCDHIYDIKFE